MLRREPFQSRLAGLIHLAECIVLLFAREQSRGFRQRDPSPFAGRQLSQPDSERVLARPGESWKIVRGSALTAERGFQPIANDHASLPARAADSVYASGNKKSPIDKKSGRVQKCEWWSQGESNP